MAASDDIWEVMSTARTIRRFTDQPVDPALLERCLQAATWAPSGGNQQPWHFVVLDSPENRELMAAGAEHALDFSQKMYRMERPAPDDQSMRARTNRAIFALHDGAADVPAAVLCCTKNQPGTPDVMLGAAIFGALENFLLAARAVGLGACVTGWQLPIDARLREALAIPDDWHLAAIVVVGWPAGQHGPLRRRPVSTIASLDTWGRPFGTTTATSDPQ